LSPPVGPKGEPPCRARDDPVPALDGPFLWVDLLVPLIPSHQSEFFQRLRYRLAARGTLVRPHLLSDIQASLIGVHFSPSIVCPAAEWLRLIGDARQHDGQSIEATFGKITERRIA
jgi:hypothetical protein